MAQSPPVQVSAGTKVTRFLATAGFAESLELRAKATLSAAQCAAYAYANVDMVKWGAAGKGAPQLLSGHAGTTDHRALLDDGRALVSPPPVGGV